MNKTNIIKKNYEFNYIFKKGNYFCGDYIECFYLKNNKNINLLGIAISSKICNAVKRNRIKRVIREAYRYLNPKINNGNTFVFLWKKKVNPEKFTYAMILQDMIKVFEKIGINIDEKNIDFFN